MFYFECPWGNFFHVVHRHVCSRGLSSGLTPSLPYYCSSVAPRVRAMFSKPALVLAVSLPLLRSEKVVTSDAAAANPIRRVVNMLQTMQTKIQAEGKNEESLYEKFACFTRKPMGALCHQNIVCLVCFPH